MLADQIAAVADFAEGSVTVDYTEADLVDIADSSVD